MIVTVRFVGAFRSISGKSKHTIKLEGNVSLSETMRKLEKEMSKLKRTLFDTELEELRMNMLILVNDKEISVLNGLETILKDGDEVVFVPVVHGG